MNLSAEAPSATEMTTLSIEKDSIPPLDGKVAIVTGKLLLLLLLLTSRVPFTPYLHMQLQDPAGIHACNMLTDTSATK